MSLTELKPCPFCGGRAEYENTDERAQLRCTGCGSLSGIYFYSEDECESGLGDKTDKRCADAWNMRAIEQELGKQEKEGYVLVPVEELKGWRNDLSLYGVGDIYTSNCIDALLETAKEQA